MSFLHEQQLWILLGQYNEKFPIFPLLWLSKRHRVAWNRFGLAVTSGFNPVSACLFGGVHGIVGTLDERIRRVILIKLDNSEAAGHGARLRGIMLFHVASDFLGQFSSCPRIVIVYENDKFLLAEASENISLADHADNHSGKFLQYAVASLVPIGVVDHLEMVDIKKDECQRHAVAFCFQDICLQQFQKFSPIKDSG